MVKESCVDLLLMTGTELREDVYCNRDKPFMDPNWKEIVEVLEPGSFNDKVLLSVSWGLYKLLSNGDYVLITRLTDSKPAGSEYYNPVSSNIDYGIHVFRTCWRPGTVQECQWK